MAALVPDVPCCVLIGEKTFSTRQSNLAFIRDKCCHLMMCLRLMEPNSISARMLRGCFGRQQFESRFFQNQATLAFLGNDASTNSSIQRIPLPTGPAEMLEEEPLYVNAKQYQRILKRRQVRARTPGILRFHLVAGGSTGPGYSLLRFDWEENIYN